MLVAAEVAADSTCKAQRLSEAHGRIVSTPSDFKAEAKDGLPSPGPELRMVCRMV